MVLAVAKILLIHTRTALLQLLESSRGTSKYSLVTFSIQTFEARKIEELHKPRRF